MKRKLQQLIRYYETRNLNHEIYYSKFNAQMPDNVLEEIEYNKDQIRNLKEKIALWQMNLQ